MANTGPRDAFKSPRFAQPPTFMRLPFRTDLAGVDLAIFGVPFDGGTVHRPGARFGPREVRAQSALIRPYNRPLRCAPFDMATVVDAGDVDASPLSIDDCYREVEAFAKAVLDAGARFLAVGGDHSVSLPLLRAVAARHGRLGLVQFDSHIDTWDGDFGSKYFHGSPFRWAVEEGLVDPARFVQVGIRGPMYGEHDFDYHREKGITVIDIDRAAQIGVEAVVAEVRRVVAGSPVYVTFDIDAADPAFAPGTGTPEVGGFTSHEALRLLRGLAGLRVVGCDVVEVAPPYDGPGQITALLAANLLFELLCVMAKAKSEG